MTPEQKAEALRLADFIQANYPMLIAVDVLLRTLAATEPHGEPVAWIQPNHLQQARRAPFLCRVEPTKRMDDFVPLYLHPSPAREPLTDAQAERLIEIIDANADESREPHDMRLVRAIERAHGITPPRSEPPEPDDPEA